jgi:hypothetical protein
MEWIKKIWRKFWEIIGALSLIHFVYFAVPPMITGATTLIIGWLYGSNPVYLFVLILVIMMASFIFMFHFIDFLKKTGIKDEKMIGPIVFIGLGILFFGTGVVWFSIGQHKSLFGHIDDHNIHKQSNTVENKNIQHLLMKGLDITKAQAKSKVYNDFLDIFLKKYDAMRNHYKKVIDLYFVPDIDDEKIMLQKREYNHLASDMRDITEKMIDEKIDLYSIESIYSLNKPFPEEDKIQDNVKKYEYRDFKYRSMSNDKRIESFMQRIRNKINENDKIINNYVNDKPLHDD